MKKNLLVLGFVFSLNAFSQTHSGFLDVFKKHVTHSAGAPKVEADISYGNAVANDLKGVDYGGNFVMGYRMKNGIFACVNFIQGARNLVPEDKLALAVSKDDKIKNIAFGIRVGYLFNNTAKEKK